MKLFVTGGAGFIGSNFVHYWLKKHPEDSILNFDKLTYAGNLENLKDVETNPHYTFIQGDICDPEAVHRAMQGSDVVVHFAAESHVDRSILDPSLFVKTNVEGTAVLLNSALEHKVQRFHHISTDEVFGALPLNSELMFTEHTAYHPHSPYSASKAGSDHLVRAYFDTYGLPITISNCSNNYGPFHFPEKLFPLAITNLLEGKKVPVYGDGLYVRDWLYVEDHCRAIDCILSKGEIGKTYLIGGMSQDIPNVEIVKKILTLMGKDESSIEYVKDRPGHDRRYAVDWSMIHRELGWEPTESIDSGLAKTIEWFQTNESWWKRVKSGAYQEYYKKQYET
ncbi:dTDP-glucose 4,6-dehydratase [Candidatus Roizmanbacteria bacterium]|nr:dTDP-glucose 4,6-dehydratase [Candidatus Roizmanbacteria bacterium]